MDKNTNKHGCCVCESCGGYNISLSVSYDGLDEESEAGKGSGFGWVVALECGDCGRVYPVARCKNYSDISDVV